MSKKSWKVLVAPFCNNTFVRCTFKIINFYLHFYSRDWGILRMYNYTLQFEKHYWVRLASQPKQVFTWLSNSKMSNPQQCQSKDHNLVGNKISYCKKIYFVWCISKNQWLFSEIDDVETGLLIEVWDKGMLWDKAIGYFWTPLQSLQFSAVVSNHYKDQQTKRIYYFLSFCHHLFFFSIIYLEVAPLSQPFAKVCKADQQKERVKAIAKWKLLKRFRNTIL